MYFSPSLLSPTYLNQPIHNYFNSKAEVRKYFSLFTPYFDYCHLCYHLNISAITEDYKIK